MFGCVVWHSNENQIKGNCNSYTNKNVEFPGLNIMGLLLFILSADFMGIQYDIFSSLFYFVNRVLYRVYSKCERQQ